MDNGGAKAERGYSGPAWGKRKCNNNNKFKLNYLTHGPLVVHFHWPGLTVHHGPQKNVPPYLKL